jgi:type II secretory pathway pseudopilin PulG
VPVAYVPVEIRRTGLLTFLAVLDFIGGGLFLLLAAGSVTVFFGARQDQTILAIGMVLVYGALGGLQVAAGIGVWQLKGWGRILQIICGAFCMPCSIFFALPALIYMVQPGAKVLFSGRQTQELNEQELSQLAKVQQRSVATTILIVAAVGLGAVAFIGIIAAIAIPSLLRARVAANESAAIGRLRTIASAEAAYASRNSGFADTPACLMAPSRCLPNQEGLTAFLDSTTTFDAPKQGYVLKFIPGTPATPDALASGTISPTSLQSFAVTAVPVTAGQTGVRSFCTDASGIVCHRVDGGNPAPDGAGCDPASCKPF